MKKVLLVATVQSHIAQFHMPLIKMLKEKGYEIHVAAKDNLKEKNGLKIENVDKIFNVYFSRSPLNLDNIKAHKQLKKIIQENKYDIVHCNTPMGGVITRLVCKKYRRKGMKVIYTAHGFHLFKGASIKNWLIYYPIEKWLSRYTDVLITINSEDYKLASNKFFAKKTQYVKGVGLDTTRLLVNNEIVDKIKKELEINEKDTVLTYIGELNNNKNQKLLLNATEYLINKKYNIKLLLLGNGPLFSEYNKMIEKKRLEKNIYLLGYRKDVANILSVTNIYVASSIREGLPINILEAMHMNLPIVATDNRGHRDLIHNGENGFIVKNNEIENFSNRIQELIENKKLQEKFKENSKKVLEGYLKEEVMNQLEEIYEQE